MGSKENPRIDPKWRSLRGPCIMLLAWRAPSEAELANRDFAFRRRRLVLRTPLLKSLVLHRHMQFESSRHVPRADRLELPSMIGLPPELKRPQSYDPKRSRQARKAHRTPSSDVRPPKAWPGIGLSQAPP